MKKILGFVLALAALAITGCSIITKADVDQCKQDSDCARYGASMQCVSGVCQQTNDTDAGADTGEDTSPELDADANVDTGCVPKTPKTSDPDFLNEKCTNASCIPFDNCQRLGLCDDAALPALISPPDGGV